MKKYNVSCVILKIWRIFISERMRHTWMGAVTILLNAMKSSIKLKKKWTILDFRFK